MSLQSIQDQIQEIGAANVVVKLNSNILGAPPRQELIGRGRLLRQAPTNIDAELSELSDIFDLGWAALGNELSEDMKNHELFTPTIRRRLSVEQQSQNRSQMRHFPHLGIIYSALNQEGLRALQDHKAVDNIRHVSEELQLIQPELGGTGIDAPATDSGWGIRRMQAIEIWKKGFTGNDILVAHLDTGVDSEHPALKDAISDHLVVDREGDETAPQNPYKDSGVHGTLTAGVIAGRNKANEPVIGMAPDAKLACATVITGGETVLRVLTGMNWAVGIGARILHMSLSFRGCNDSFEDTMEILRANHVLPVIAIGNSGPNSSRSPGNYKTALSVGAIDQSNEVVFDSSSPKPGGNAVGPSLCAPGWLISSSHAGGGYQAKSGTSMATPHITGLAALLFDAQPNATIDQIQEAIIASCENPTGVEKLRIGAGIPNSLKALNILTELI